MHGVAQNRWLDAGMHQGKHTEESEKFEGYKIEAHIKWVRQQMILMSVCAALCVRSGRVMVVKIADDSVRCPHERHWGVSVVYMHSACKIMRQYMFLCCQFSTNCTHPSWNHVRYPPRPISEANCCIGGRILLIMYFCAKIHALHFVKLPPSAHLPSCVNHTG